MSTCPIKTWVRYEKSIYVVEMLKRRTTSIVQRFCTFLKLSIKTVFSCTIWGKNTDQNN